MFSFAEIKPPLRKDVDAATGADRYSKYLWKLNIWFNNKIPDYKCSTLIFIIFPKQMIFFVTKKYWQNINQENTSLYAFRLLKGII